MKYLWENGYRAFSLSEAIRFIRMNESFPKNMVVITFDDGYKNIYTQAFPVLNQYGFKATIFLITDYCGTYKAWPGHLPSTMNRPMLSWAEIREMNKEGFEFGSHTVSHPDLTRMPIRQAEQEILQSKAKIQDHLCARVRVFAYPYGRFNSEIEEIVRGQFSGACSTRLGKNRKSCDPYRLKRIDMYYLSSYRLFCMLSTNIMDLYLQIRQVIRDLREMSLHVKI